MIEDGKCWAQWLMPTESHVNMSPKFQPLYHVKMLVLQGRARDIGFNIISYILKYQHRNTALKQLFCPCDVPVGHAGTIGYQFMTSMLRTGNSSPLFLFHVGSLQVAYQLQFHGIQVSVDAKRYHSNLTEEEKDTYSDVKQRVLILDCFCC